MSRYTGSVHPQFNPLRSIRTGLLVVIGDSDSINPVDRVCLPPSPSPPTTPFPLLAFHSLRSMMMYHIIQFAPLANH